MYRKTYVEIDVDKVKKNIETYIKTYNDYQYYIGVIKGDAYSHTDLIINDMIESGINYLAVSSLEEALSARKQNKTIPILCIEPISLDYINVCIENNITITLSNYEYFLKLKRMNIKDKLKIHIKIDSGMNRLGFKNREQIKEIYDYLIKDENLILDGLYSHFATLGLTDKKWDIQLEKFKSLTKDIDLSKIPVVHLGRSMTILNHKKLDFTTGVRLGIGMFGFARTPIPTSTISKLKSNIKKKLYKISPTMNTTLDVEQAFTLKSEIMAITDVKKGEYVGYGLVYKADSDKKIGIVPIGYGDGFSRRNTGRNVSINGKKYPIISDVCMDMIFIEIDDSVKIGDEVTLMGEDIPIRYVANHLGTTPYESMLMINYRVPRILIKNGKKMIIKSKFECGEIDNEK